MKLSVENSLMSDEFESVSSFDSLCEEGDRNLSLLSKSLSNTSSFTLGEVVDAFEKSWKSKSSQGLSYCYNFSVSPQGPIWNRRVNVFLGKSILLEGDIQGISIYSALNYSLGLKSFWISNQSCIIATDCNVFSEEEFYQEVRKSQFFRWLGRRKPTTCSLSILKMDWETFFESAKTFLPELIKAGIWKCEGPSCPIGHAVADPAA